MPRDHATEQIPGEGRGWGLAEQLGPPHPELFLAESLQPLNLSPDFGFLDFAHDGTQILGLEKAAPAMPIAARGGRRSRGLATRPVLSALGADDAVHALAVPLLRDEVEAELLSD